MYVYKCVCLQSDIPLSSAGFIIFTASIGNLLYSLIASGENSVFAHFVAATANHYNIALSFH